MKRISRLIRWPIGKFKKLSPKGKIITLIIIGLIALWRINVYRNSGLEVELTKVRKGNLTESVSASGEITSSNAATLSFQTAGEVKEVNFKIGDKVKKGDIISKLDTTQLYALYQQADANLRAAQASLNYTYDVLQGKEKTETFSDISTRTVAETNKDKAYWAFVAASKNLNGAIIRAPFDGILTTIPNNLVPGTIISLPSSGIFEVVSPSSTYFEADVNENDVNLLTEGTKAEVNIDAFPEESFPGVLNSINFGSTRTSTGGTAYKVQISLPENNNLKFRLGMNGDANLIISEKNDVLLVPITAVTEDTDNSYVWTVKDGKAQKVMVETGISSIDEVEIISGLSEGAEIISRPPSTIEESSKLKIKG